MRRSRKIILISLLTIVVLAGSIGGVVLAQTENGDNSQPKAQYQALLDKVCAIYEKNTGVAIDSQKLNEAFAQARNEAMAEAQDKFLQGLIDEGKITNDQAEQYKTWLKSKPEVNIPFGHGMPGPGMHRGFGGPGGGFPGWCEPQPAE